MKHFLDKFKGFGSVLQKPGDKIEARVTKSNRKVLKLSKDNGKYKQSYTEYPTELELRLE